MESYRIVIYMTRIKTEYEDTFVSCGVVMRFWCDPPKSSLCFEICIFLTEAAWFSILIKIFRMYNVYSFLRTYLFVPWPSARFLSDCFSSCKFYTPRSLEGDFSPSLL